MPLQPRRQLLAVVRQFFGVAVVHTGIAAAVAAVGGQGRFWWLWARVELVERNKRNHAVHYRACGNNVL